MTIRPTTFFVLLIFSTDPCLLLSQTIAGTWNLTEGKYNNVAIANLTGEMIITNVNADDSLNYLATFDNGTHQGTARARYTIQNNKFKSNLTGANNIALNGFSASYSNGPGGLEYNWITSLSISSTAFNQWGGTAIGHGDPTFSMSGNGNLLTFTSANGSAVLIYERDNVMSADSPQKEEQGFIYSGIYPNPILNETTFSLQLLESASVRLLVFDWAGRQLTSVVEGVFLPGEYSFNWESGDLPSGIYAYQLLVNRYAINGLLIIQR